MASKGQKFRSYSAELKQIILKEYFDGVETPRTLSLKYDVPSKTMPAVPYIAIASVYWIRGIFFMISEYKLLTIKDNSYVFVHGFLNELTQTLR